ncbi:MAG: DNA repair protein RadC [Planctomycetota bacterium]|nr:MAG: DNA repair protein RadC [Planctomycetota bacterium]
MKRNSESFVTKRRDCVCLSKTEIGFQNLTMLELAVSKIDPLAPADSLSPPQKLSDERLLARLCQHPGGESWEKSVRRLGGLAALAGLEAVEISRHLGLVADVGWRLQAAVELGRRIQCRQVQRPQTMRGGEAVYQYLASRVQGVRVECFWALYLDVKGRLLWEEKISEGTLTASLVHPREVFAPALLHRAAAVVVAHNHPSGDPEPSADDRATTKRLRRAGRLLGIELLDHVILGAGCFTSFVERGWL